MEQNKHTTQFYRAGVGAVIANVAGKVMLFERTGQAGEWQFPQGGMEWGEEPEQTVFREVLEETGIESADIDLIAVMPQLLAYEIPAEHRDIKTGRGQVQQWFVFRYVGDERAVTLGDRVEFQQWRWASMDEAVAAAVEFKKPVYEVLAGFLRELSSHSPK